MRCQQAGGFTEFPRGGAFLATTVYKTAAGVPIPITNDIVITSSILDSGDNLTPLTIEIDPDQVTNAGKFTMSTLSTLWPLGEARWDVLITTVGLPIFTNTRTFDIYQPVTPISA